MRVFSWWATLTCGLALGACGIETDPEQDPTTTLRGTLTGPAETGQLEVRVSNEVVEASHDHLVAGHSAPLPAGARSAHGTITWPDQSTSPLSGQVLDSKLNLSGSGYELTGPWSETGLAGTYTGPNGPGSFTVGLPE